MTTIAPAEALLTVDDVAAMTGIARQTIYKWRCETPEKAPRAVMIGRRVRFRREDVDDWINSLAEGGSGAH